MTEERHKLGDRIVFFVLIALVMIHLFETTETPRKKDDSVCVEKVEVSK